MNSSMHGKDILTNNGVTNITHIGFWILIENTEYFVPFDHYPCFKNATIHQITDFRIISPDQLYWESLDCDIELKALKDPQNYPLQFQK
jgi:hypothetical protein